MSPGGRVRNASSFATGHNCDQFICLVFRQKEKKQKKPTFAKNIATIVPFSSDALYVAVLMATHNPVGCLVVGTLGNWLGSVTTYWIGRIGRWEWIERWFKVSPEAMERQKKKVDRYGIWLALLAWVPFIGDVFTLALGFFKTKPVGTILLLLVGKFLRFLVWNFIIGAL